MTSKVTAEMVKELREKTGAGMLDCKKALEANCGDFEKSINYLRQKGMAQAAQKATRVAKEGVIYSYIHPGEKLGVLLELNCETDFVARTEDFKSLAKDIAMQIAATNPVVVSRSDLKPEALEQEKNIYRAQALNEGKPEKIVEKIIEGKVEKYYQEVCLLEQAFVKDQDRTVQERVNEAVAKLGENIVVKRFARFRLGE